MISYRKNHMNTYCSGPEFRTVKDITRDDIMTLCDNLNNEIYFKNEIVFKPEAITEGGIRYFYKNNENFYKTIRLRGEYNNWPYIKDHSFKDWINNDEVIYGNDTMVRTYLKAFDFAPEFTDEEMGVLLFHFYKIGLNKFGRFKKLNRTPDVIQKQSNERVKRWLNKPENKKSIKCDTCDKILKNKTTYNKHLNTKMHKKYLEDNNIQNDIDKPS